MADDYLVRYSHRKPNNYEQLKAEMEKKKKIPTVLIATPPVGDYPQWEEGNNALKNRACSFSGTPADRRGLDCPNGPPKYYGR